MPFGIIIYKSEPLEHYVNFEMADDTLYDKMKEVLSTEQGIKMYGMRFISGIKGIKDENADRICDIVHNLVQRKNKRENIELEKELEKIV